ncbi:alanine racemase [Salmonella enterica subsp. enterica serovar Heidelberg]|nr:alanine racemase [Salmonella enterica subsp. enterica serovar Heidelberg]
MDTVFWRPRERSLMLTLLAWRVLKRLYVCERAGSRSLSCCWRVFFDAADLPTISAQCLHTAVHNQEQLAALEAVELAEPVTVWMKLDTGMHRLGVRPEEAEAFYQRLTHCKNVRQPVNIVSHFARADEPECGATEHQLDIFNAFCQGKPGQRSIAASGGILLWPQSHFDWARPGIILYGVSPLEHKPWGPDFGFSAGDVLNLQFDRGA